MCVDTELNYCQHTETPFVYANRNSVSKLKENEHNETWNLA